MRAKRLARHIERTVIGPMWHGPALAQALEGVTHEQAGRRPVSQAHSIWEIVLHVSVWAEIARARLNGERTGDPAPEDDWPSAGSGAKPWRLAVDRLGASYHELAAATRKLGDDSLDAKVANLDYTIGTMLRGVVEHGTYHGGQIMILRKALEAQR